MILQSNRIQSTCLPTRLPLFLKEQHGRGGMIKIKDAHVGFVSIVTSPRVAAIMTRMRLVLMKWMLLLLMMVVIRGITTIAGFAPVLSMLGTIISAAQSPMHHGTATIITCTGSRDSTHAEFTSMALDLMRMKLVHICMATIHTTDTASVAVATTTNAITIMKIQMNGKGLPSDMHRWSRRRWPSSHVGIDGIAGAVTKILVGSGGRRRLPQQSASGSQQGWTAQDGSRPATNSQNDRNLHYIRDEG